MVSATELCAAVESLLAIDYSKRYMPWKEQNIVNLARAIAQQYRRETNSIPPAEILTLQPSEAKTYAEGLVEEQFDFSEPTWPDGIPLVISDAQSPSVAVPAPMYTEAAVTKMIDLLGLANYEAHP